MNSIEPGNPSENTSLISLALGEIHVWLAYYDEIDDRELLARYREILNTEERYQELRFHFPRDRRRYLVTRTLVRTTLSRYARVRAQDWAFTSNEYGCPGIANEVIGSDLTFNISHTDGLIVLAIARGCAVGVDVENLIKRDASLEIADQFFSASEVSELSQLPRDKQHFRFLEYWTLKESYIKARGMGLSIPLDCFSFNLTRENEITLTIDSGLNDQADRWQLWQFRPQHDYIVAVCAERLTTYSFLSLVKVIVPLNDIERTLEPEFERISN